MGPVTGQPANSDSSPEQSLPELPPGEWMFKLRGEVLGPVPSREIYGHMVAGDIDEATPLSREEGAWRSVQQRTIWMPFLHQAKAQIRARQARAEAERAARKRRLRSLINWTIGGVFLVLISFALSYLIIVRRPGRTAEALAAWADKHVPLMLASSAGGPAATPGDATGGAGTRYGDIEIDQILVEDAPDLVAIKPGGRRRSDKRRRRKRRGDDRKPDRKPGAAAEKGAAGADSGTAVASVGTLDKPAIIRRVYARRNMRRLTACLKSEIERNPDLPGRIELSFSIKNDGHIHNVQLDDIRLRDGPLQQCMQRKLSKLTFSPYRGQVQNVTVPFNWKR